MKDQAGAAAGDALRHRVILRAAVRDLGAVSAGGIEPDQGDLICSIADISSPSADLEIAKAGS